MNRTLGAIAMALLGLSCPLPGPAQESMPRRLAPIQIPAHPRDLILPESSWRPPSAARHRVTLDGGATAFLIEDSTLPLVDIVVVARAGAYYDPPNTPGVSEMTATMLRRGGTVSLDPASFDERADELGAILTSQATMLYGAASLRCTTAVLEEAVALLFDMIEHPRFDSARLGSIKRNLAEGMARRNLDPLRVIEREWQWLIFGEDHFSTRPLSASDLDSLTSAVLNEFHRRHWRPENLKLAVAGDIDGERLETLFGPRLRAWAAALSPAATRPWPPPGPEKTPRPGLFHFDADIPQAKVAMGHRAPGALPTVEQRVEIEVLAEILGGRGAISRLNGRLRSAEGLVYRTTTRLDPGDLWPADYQIFFDTLDHNTPRAVAAVLEEIERLRTT
ncbi:MAG: pitrilysin family protein, partial [Acidobacteria bacterium]|nr:pitrilysin family protein [Acidobacteriota bacterium]